MIKNKILGKIDDLEYKFDESEKQPIDTKMSTWYFSLWQNKMLLYLLFNLLILVGLAGIVISYFNFLSQGLEISAFLPFNQTSGIGYPFVTSASSASFYQTLSAQNTAFLYLIPSFVFAGLLLSGIFYVIKKMVQKIHVSFFKDFWQGFKKNFWSFAIILLIFSLYLYAFNYANSQIAIQVFENGNSFGWVLLQILLYLSLILYGMMTLFMLSILTTYKANFVSLIKNSFLLTVGLLPRNTFALFLTMLPIIFILANILTQFMIILYVMLGAFATLLIWILYSEYIFQSKASYVPVVEQVAEEKDEKQPIIYAKAVEKKKKPNKKTEFVNPKKKKNI